MKNKIQNYIKELNSNYENQLRDQGVDYINAYGQFLNAHKVLARFDNNNNNNTTTTKEITAKYIVIAVGGRPKYPADIKGAKEYAITSDDLFSLDHNPGKTLCVGASYVSLECAGFLNGIGLDVTVMVRSILLRGFDQEMATKIGDYMENYKQIKFIKDSVPIRITRVKDGKPGQFLVEYKNTTQNKVSQEIFNTIVLAIGREPCTKDLNLTKLGIKINPDTQKILTNYEQTNIDNIYAIGDVIEEKSANGRVLELTPVAIKQGQLLADRLFNNSQIKMNYNAVPTTVFTPLEYGCIGYSEEEAEYKYGKENIKIYYSDYLPLEWAITNKQYITSSNEYKLEKICCTKLICDKNDNERIIGLHVLMPNAGEITQGYAVAIKLKATKEDFDMTIGLHPTCSEALVSMGGGC